MADFINIKDIVGNCELEPIDKQKMYQIQLHDNKKSALIMHIGYSNCISDIVLSEYKYCGKEYHIISCFIDDEIINSNAYILPIISILITTRKNKTTYMQYNFVLNNQEPNNKITSTIDNKVYLSGTFTITYHVDNKYTVLKKYNDGLDIDSAIKEMLILSLKI